MKNMQLIMSDKHININNLYIKKLKNRHLSKYLQILIHCGVRKNTHIYSSTFKGIRDTRLPFFHLTELK